MNKKLFSVVALTLASGAWAKNVECRATANNLTIPFQMVVDWTLDHVGMTLQFDSKPAWGEAKTFNVVYQGLGAADFDAKPQSNLIALSTAGGEMVEILWETGSGFGFGGYGKGTMKLGQQMQPGGEFGKYLEYAVDCTAHAAN